MLTRQLSRCRARSLDPSGSCFEASPGTDLAKRGPGTTHSAGPQQWPRADVIITDPDNMSVIYGMSGRLRSAPPTNFLTAAGIADDAFSHVMTHFGGLLYDTPSWKRCRRRSKEQCLFKFSIQNLAQTHMAEFQMSGPTAFVFAVASAFVLCILLYDALKVILFICKPLMTAY